MPVVAGKRELCSSNLKYFKSIQGIGNYSIIDRYEALSVIVSKKIDSKYHDFLAQPVAESNNVTWYSCIYTETPCLLNSLKDEMYEKYKSIKEETVAHYNKVVKNLYSSGDDLDAEYLEKAVKYVDDRFVYCLDDKVVLGIWGMQLRENIEEPYGVAVFKMYDVDHFFVKFLPGEYGTVVGKSVIKKEAGSRVSEEDVPTIVANEGFSFAGWSLNPVGRIVDNNIQFTATYNMVEHVIPKQVTPVVPIVDPKPAHNKCRVTFNPGEHGTINGTSSFEFEKGHVITNSIIPIVLPQKGYVFKGWDVNPNTMTVDKDITFNAVYKKKCTWCKWLLWGLLFLLLLLLLILLLRRCDRAGCAKREALVFSGDTLVSGWFYDNPEPYEPTPTDPRYRDVLPPFEKVLPPVDTTKIIDNPERPGEIISDGLLIINKDSRKSIMDLAVAFHNVYPDYQVVYYNTDTDIMLVQVPEGMRDTIKSEIHNKIPDFDFYVTELSTVGIGYVPNDSKINNSEINWYFKAINAFEGWDITMGSEDVIVAIVDNGFCLNNPELKHRIVLPYNSFEHNGRIFPAAIDHGSHVAGTAIGEMNNKYGVCGIAPKCKFMPIKVADENGIMHTISILEGVMFAVKHGADVINISLGMNGLDSVASLQPEYLQRAMMQTMYKEEEFLWRTIDEIAEKNGATIVYAAGNFKVLAGVDPQKRSENVIRVSAVEKKGNQYTKAYFSNYGELSTLSAPGVGIYSCYGENKGIIMNGTSMAAPLVSGAVALMKSINNTLTSQEIIEILQTTGEPIPGDTLMGNLIKIDKALNSVKNKDKAREVPSTGDVQIHLEWNDYNDLDLICIDPYRDSVYFKKKKVPSGGVLEIDKNAKRPYTNNAQENIYWPEGKAPNGTYQVYVLYYENHDNAVKETSYRMMIKHGDKVDNIDGHIKRKELKHVFTFKLDN